MTDIAHPRRREEPLHAASVPSSDVDQEPDDATAVAEVAGEPGEGSTPKTRQPAVCPNCSEPTELTEVRKMAEEFCLACDHPLFWIAAFIRSDDDGDELVIEASLRRRPGTAGRRRLVGVPCPECEEPNDVKAVFCLRCSAPMDPQAKPREVPAPVTPETVLVVPPSEPRVPFWMIVLFAAIGLLLLLAMVGVVVT